MKNLDNKEILRVTIAIALIATFLTLLLNIAPQISNDNWILFLLKGAIYVNFGGITMCFFLFIIYLGRRLKHQKDENDSKPGDLSVVILYPLLWLYWLVHKKNKPKDKKELRALFYLKKSTLPEFFYDEGIRLSFFFPIILLNVLLYQIVVKFINHSFLIIIGFIITYVIIGLSLNYLRYKIIGEQ
jgi:hypothetical protein